MLLLLRVENDAKTLWDSSLTTKKGEIHGSSILKNQANKQQCMKRKMLSSFSIKTQIPGKLHIKKANKQRGNMQMKAFPLLVKPSTVENTRFMIASAAFTELFLNIDIYYTIYLMLPVHFQRTNAEKRLKVVTQPGSVRGTQWLNYPNNQTNTLCTALMPSGRCFNKNTNILLGLIYIS